MSEHVRMWIGGEWVVAEGGATFEATSPSTGAIIGTVPEGTRADAQRAIDAANAAAPGWAASSAFDRAAAMKRVAEAIDARRDVLAHTLALDQGKPLAAEARDEVEELIAYFDMAAADAIHMDGVLPPSVDANKRVLLYRVPRGVVSIISPLELAVHDARRDPGPRDRVRERRGVGPSTEHQRVRRGDGRGVGGRRSAARGGQHGHRPRSGRGGRDRRESGHPGGRVHRLDRDR